MHTEVTGLVLRSYEVGEADRLITVFTKEKGTVTALVKGARSLKNKNMAACMQYCYGSFILYSKGDKLWVKEASLIESFFNLRSSIEALSLAGYIVEVLSEITVESPDPDLLRLALNCLFAISEKKYPLAKIKAAFEIRALAIIGYMPALLECRDCGKKEGDFFFDIMGGNIQCAECHKKDEEQRLDTSYDVAYARIIKILSEGAKVALSYCIYCPLERLFAFKIPDGDMDYFCSAAESYLVNMLERSFKTLEFYKEVKR